MISSMNFNNSLNAKTCLTDFGNVSNLETAIKKVNTTITTAVLPNVNRYYQSYGFVIQRRFCSLAKLVFKYQTKCKIYCKILYKKLNLQSISTLAKIGVRAALCSALICALRSVPKIGALLHTALQQNFPALLRQLECAPEHAPLQIVAPNIT